MYVKRSGSAITVFLGFQSLQAVRLWWGDYDSLGAIFFGRDSALRAAGSGDLSDPARLRRQHRPVWRWELHDARRQPDPRLHDRGPRHEQAQADRNRQGKPNVITVPRYVVFLQFLRHSPISQNMFPH